jgi:hypothetical protein
MDSKVRTFAVVWAVGYAALGCGAGERFRTVPAGAGGASAAAGVPGWAGASAAGAAAIAGGMAGARAQAGEQGAADHAAAGAPALAEGGLSAAAAGGAARAVSGGAGGSVGLGGESASGTGPMGGVGGSASRAGAGGSESFAGSAGSTVAGSAGTAVAGSAGADSGQTFPDELPALYAEAACAAVRDCSQELASILFGANDCVSYVAEQVKNAWLPVLQAAVDDGTVIYSADKLDGCLEAVSRLGCRFDAHDYLGECEAAFEGTRALGEPCEIDAECMENRYCRADGHCPGTCSAREPVGESCRRDTDCSSEYYCGQNGKCAARIEVGTGCHPDVERCVPGALCVGADPSTNTLGHCEPVGSVFTQLEDSTCDIGQGELCAGELSCTFISTDENALPTCRKRAAGTACRLAVPDACPRQQYCKGISSDLIGSCSALPDDGDPCVGDPVFGKRCAQDNVCLEDTCVQLRTNGQDCGADAECFSGACSADGFCVPLSACGS